MDLNTVFAQLGISLGLGLLVGLQREWAASQLAGLRTFPLVTILGSVCAMLGQSFGGWIVATGLIAVAGMIVIGNIARLKEGEASHGLTTEIAMLLMFAVGAYLVTGYKEAAIAVGGGVAVLLHFKGELHGMAARLGDNDLKAIMQFALISMVILPVLPDRAFGPYEVLNPRNIWWMVVLVVGLSLAGYILYKFFGEKAGVVLGGILGGLISSTATTMSYARLTARTPETARPAALIIMIASTVVFGRIILEIALVAPAFLTSAAPPLLILLALAVVLSIGAWFWVRKEKTEMPPQQNPTELKTALVFGLLYAIVLLAVAAAKARFGGKGLYVVAGLSGLTDVDAITLSTSQLVASDRLAATDGWRIIVIALMSNLVFKAAIIAVLGNLQLLAKVGLFYLLTLGAGAILLFVWP